MILERVANLLRTDFNVQYRSGKYKVIALTSYYGEISSDWHETVEAAAREANEKYSAAWRNS